MKETKHSPLNVSSGQSELIESGFYTQRKSTNFYEFLQDQPVPNLSSLEGNLKPRRVGLSGGIELKY